MECSKCNLRFNKTQRKPKINQCGHTICETCCNKLSFCPSCQNMIDKNKLIINQSLLALLEENRASNDIDKMIKVCFAGESKVGKTSLINRLKGSEYKENTIATIGYDFAFVDRDIDGYNIRFQLWDSAGQERYRAISPLHYKNSNILVIVYDVTQQGKKNNVYSWYQQAVKHCPEDTIKILVGNKIDLLEVVNKKSMNPLQPLMWKSIAEQNIKNYEVSCKTYEGIEQFWRIIQDNVKIILQRINIYDNPFKDRQTAMTKSSSIKKNQQKDRKIDLNKQRSNKTQSPSEKSCSC